MLTALEREHYFEHGYLIVRNVLNKTQIEQAKLGIQRLVDRAKSGEGSDIPWINKERGIPNRLSDLLSPAHFQPEFAEVIENTSMVDIIEGIFEEPIRFSLFNMLASGDGKGYVQDWHRDILPSDGPSLITEAIKIVRRICQLNAALFEDRYFTIVPGSHLRRTTTEELQVLRDNPKGPMPGEITVELLPGDIVFYFNNLLHRGYNPEGILRWTLHCAFWTADSPVFDYSEGNYQEMITEQLHANVFGPRLRALMEGYIKAGGIS